MVWGCMAASGVGNLIFIEGILDKAKYLHILKDNLKKSAVKLGLLENFYFQQDNDPKHKAKIVQEWLLYNIPHMLHTPPQSPDINPIEHLWTEIGKRLQNHNITSKDQLKEKILQIWNSIEPTVTENLVNSMGRRLSEIIKAKGGTTKY
ncbi:Transposable element Tc1 transposase [Anthophora quadrimaculata]